MSDPRVSSLFSDEAREHWRAVAESADRELSIVRAEQAVEDALRMENERFLAKLLGLPSNLAPVLGVAVYSSSHGYRERAVEILVRALGRQGKVAA